MTPRRRWSPLALSCPQVVELLSDWLDGALDARTAARVQRHLAGCDGCAAYLDQLRASIAAVGALPAPEPSPQLCDALVDAFREWRLSPDGR